MLLAILFLLLYAVAAEDSGVTCGHAFRDLIRLCGHPTLSTPSSCCPAIRHYNDALCWCQPTGLSLASLLATNSFAFSLRAETCNVTTPFRPSFGSRDFPATPDTCPPSFASVAADDTREGCVEPAMLRRRRQAALVKLDTLALTGSSDEEVAAFKESTKTLFVEGVSFASVGLASGMGIDVATDLLLSRQPVLGATAGWVLPDSRAEISGKFWRQGMVSYTLYFASPGGRFASRSMFVGFELCSERMLEVYAVEEGVVDAIAAQFYYPVNPPDAVSMYNQTPKDICKLVTDGCGELSPYESADACEEFMAELKKAKKVMCNRFDKKEVSVLALLGDTTSCRYSYALAAKADPKRYCPLLGTEPKGLCAESLCASGEFEDIFTAENPRYEASSSFKCNLETGECVENWPRRVD